MTLLDEFLAREKLSRALAAADAARLQADAGLAEIEACRQRDAPDIRGIHSPYGRA